MSFLTQTLIGAGAQAVVAGGEAGKTSGLGIAAGAPEGSALSINDILRLAAATRSAVQAQNAVNQGVGLGTPLGAGSSAIQPLQRAQVAGDTNGLGFESQPVPLQFPDADQFAGASDGSDQLASDNLGLGSFAQQDPPGLVTQVGNVVGGVITGRPLASQVQDLFDPLSSGKPRKIGKPAQVASFIGSLIGQGRANIAGGTGPVQAQQAEQVARQQRAQQALVSGAKFGRTVARQQAAQPISKQAVVGKSALSKARAGGVSSLFLDAAKPYIDAGIPIDQQAAIERFPSISNLDDAGFSAAMRSDEVKEFLAQVNAQKQGPQVLKDFKDEFEPFFGEFGQDLGASPTIDQAFDLIDTHPEAKNRITAPARARVREPSYRRAAKTKAEGRELGRFTSEAEAKTQRGREATAALAPVSFVKMAMLKNGTPIQGTEIDIPRRDRAKIKAAQELGFKEIRGTGTRAEQGLTGLTTKGEGLLDERAIQNVDVLAATESLDNLFDPEFFRTIPQLSQSVRQRLVKTFGGDVLSSDARLKTARFGVLNRRLSEFKNSVIKRITGAQMSEAEAERILEQVITQDMDEVTARAVLDDIITSTQLAIARDAQFRQLFQSGEMNEMPVGQKAAALTSLGEMRADILEQADARSTFWQEQGLGEVEADVKANQEIKQATGVDAARLARVEF